MRTETSALTEGALLAALTAVLVLIGYLIPPLMLITSMSWTCPIVVLVVRRGFRVGLLATVVTGFLIMLIIGPVQALLLVVNFGVLGLAYGHLFRSGAGTARVLIGGVLAAVVASAVGMGLIFLVAGGSFAGIKEQLRMSVDMAFDMYQRAGILEQMAGQGIDPAQLRTDLLRLSQVLLPGALVMGAIFAALVNLLVSRKVLQRLRLPAPELPSFREWQLPWYMVWGVIAGLGLWLAGDYYGWPLGVAIGQNILIVYSFVLMITGLAVMVFFFRLIRLSPVIRMVLIVLLVLNLSFVILALVGTGLFDMLFNYRRLAGNN